MNKACRKSAFTLLEVMIAFMLIVMCVFPLIYPHAFVLLSQKKFMQEIEIDHLVNLAYADIIERLYWNEIPFGDLINGREFAIDEPFLQRISFDKPLPYRGFYRFSKILYQKPRKEDETPTHFLLQLELTFIPEGIEQEDKDQLPDDALNYTYKVFVIRDLGKGVLPEEQEEVPAQNGEQKSQEIPQLFKPLG